MKQRSPEQLKDECDTFNKRCKIGAAVWLEMDDGTKVNTRVRHEATILGGHTAMGWFEGIAGCYLLARATPIDEGPILFTGELVRKILTDDKTETRRVVDPKLWPIIEQIEKVNGKLAWQCADFDLPCRYDHEQLWVKEGYGPKRGFGIPEIAATKPSDLDESEEIIYRATDPWATKLPVNLTPNWRPSIFMCRWMSRIDLRVKEILLQRLQDMRPEDALAEGIEMYGSSTSAPFNAMDDFRRLWDKINGRRPGCAWKDNPIVWCIRFERM